MNMKQGTYKKSDSSSKMMKEGISKAMKSADKKKPVAMKSADNKAAKGKKK